MLAKTKSVRSNKLRDSAAGERCTFEILGVCNGDPDTTVLCHLPDESHGMSRKSDDFCSAYGCSTCHAAIDGRVQSVFVSESDKQWYMRRAMVRTWRRMIEKGLVKIG
jgi:hypothetical protein